MSYKQDRTAEDMHRELSALLRELKDPRIAPLTSIVKIDLAGDLSHCKVYVSCVEGIEKANESVEGLKSAEGFIKREIFSRLKIRKCPDFKFIADDSIEYSAQIGKIIDGFASGEQQV
jgi:ribosome-binding factor A